MAVMNDGISDPWGDEQLDEIPQAVRIAEYLFEHHKGQKILDVGCGRGLYVYAMRAVGLDAYGIDIDERLVESRWLTRSDITQPVDLHANVLLSLEVGEHIEHKMSGTYISNLCCSTRADIIYFSAAHVGQGGKGHINCQPRSYWTRLFCRYGWYVDPEATEAWLTWMRQGYHMGWLVQNGMILRSWLVQNDTIVHNEQ
jgi:SAM-dependent methyltransferase